MENFEKFVIQNREAFDEATPSLKVWAGIDKQLTQKKRKRRFVGNFSSMAAAAALFLVVGLALGVYLSAEQNGQPSVAEIAPEFAEMEAYYVSQVSQKQKEIATFVKDETIEEDLSQMDEVLLELKSELINAPKGSREAIINAMIANYQTKIDVLERILEQTGARPENLKEDENSI